MGLYKISRSTKEFSKELNQINVLNTVLSMVTKRINLALTTDWR